MRALLALALSLVLAAPAWAQSTTRTGEPTSIGIATGGIVIMAAGIGMMLHYPPCNTGGQACGSDTGWLIGGVAVVAAGVATVYLGLRPRRVIIAPALSRRTIGVQGRVVWGH